MKHRCFFFIDDLLWILRIVIAKCYDRDCENAQHTETWLCLIETRNLSLVLFLKLWLILLLRNRDEWSFWHWGCESFDDHHFFPNHIAFIRYFSSLFFVLCVLTSCFVYAGVIDGDRVFVIVIIEALVRYCDSTIFDDNPPKIWCFISIPFLLLVYVL
jgi:hypothetical protein